MRLATTIRRNVIRDGYGGTVCDEENEVVGDVVDVGNDEPLITIESVDGVPARWLSRRERDEYEERLWDEYLRATEAA